MASGSKSISGTLDGPHGQNRDAFVGAPQSLGHGPDAFSGRAGESMDEAKIAEDEIGTDASSHFGNQATNIGVMNAGTVAGSATASTKSAPEVSDVGARDPQGESQNVGTTEQSRWTENQCNRAAASMRRQRSSHRQRRLPSNHGQSRNSLIGSERDLFSEKSSVPDRGGGDSDFGGGKFDYEIEEEKQQQEQQRQGRGRTDENADERKVGCVEEPSTRRKPKSHHIRDDSSTSGEIPPHHLAGGTTSDDDPMVNENEGYDDFMINNTGKCRSVAEVSPETDRLRPEKMTDSKREASGLSDSPPLKPALGEDATTDPFTVDDKVEFVGTSLEHTHNISAVESMASDDQLSTAATTTSSGRAPPANVGTSRDRRGRVVVPDRPGAYNVPGRAHGQVPRWGRRARPLTSPTTTQAESSAPTVSTPNGPLDSASRPVMSAAPSPIPTQSVPNSHTGDRGTDEDDGGEIVVSAFGVEEGHEDTDEDSDEDEDDDNDCGSGGDDEGAHRFEARGWEQETREGEAFAVATPANSNRTSEGPGTENSSRRRKKRRTRRCKSWKLRAGIMVGLCVAVAVLAALTVILTIEIVASKDDGEKDSSRGGKDTKPTGRTTGQSGELGDGVIATAGCKLLVNITPKPQQREQFELLRDLLVKDNVSSDESLNGAECTNQQRALAWISFLDDRSQRIMGNATSDIDPTAYNVLIQRYAVAVLYGELEGGSWHSRTGWLEDSSECGWEFLECDGDDSQKLTEVRMMKNAAKGKIPNEIGVLPSLVSVKMSGNQISSSIPDEINSLTGLESLDLSNNQITGTIPSTIELMVSLKSLDLSGNKLSGTVPAELRVLPSIRKIDLRGNNFTQFSAEDFCINTMLRLCTDSDEECSCCVSC